MDVIADFIRTGFVSESEMVELANGVTGSENTLHSLETSLSPACVYTAC